MNILRTDRTYKTYDNALAALRRGCAKLGVDFDSVRYVIAARKSMSPDAAIGIRFAPAVLYSNARVHGSEFIPTIDFIHAGITVIG